MDPVELQETPELGPDLFLNVIRPPVGRETVRTVLCLVDGDVIWAFETDDVIAFQLITAVTACDSVRFDPQAQFGTSRLEGGDVLDLGLYFSEV